MSRKSNSSLPKVSLSQVFGEDWKYKTISNRTLNKFFITLALICTLILGVTIGKIVTARTIKIAGHYDISKEVGVIVLDIGGSLEEYCYLH
jgi:hypothetical protein